LVTHFSIEDGRYFPVGRGTVTEGRLKYLLHYIPTRAFAPKFSCIIS